MVEEKVPLLFVTTSRRKFDHIQHLGEEVGINVYRVEREYEEIQRDNLEHLLEDSMRRSFLQSLHDTFFIIEQTSVFFEAYDDQPEGYPGQSFKKWWKNESEQMTPEDKVKLSKNPGARIESGLALNVPGHEPLVFINEKRGKISFEGGHRKENEQYSWLSADDFNRYFVPEGARKVYNQMTLREFRNHDFRRPNFEQVSARIGEYSAILDSGVSFESLKERAKEESTPESWQTESQSRLDIDFGG